MDFISGWMDSHGTEYSKEAPGDSRDAMLSSVAINTIICHVLLYAIKMVCDLYNGIFSKFGQPRLSSYAEDYVNQDMSLPGVQIQQQKAYKNKNSIKNGGVDKTSFVAVQSVSTSGRDSISDCHCNATQEPVCKEAQATSEEYETSKSKLSETQMNDDQGYVCVDRQCNCAVASMHMRTLDNVTYSGHSDEDLIEFIDKINNHFSMCPTTNEVYKVHFLCSHLRDQARMLAKFQMEKCDNSSITFNTIVEHLKNTFLCEQMKEILRIELNERIQGENECVSDYIAEMCRLANRIELSDQEIKRELIRGYRPEIKLFVMRKFPQDFIECIQFGRLAEMIHNLEVKKDKNVVSGGLSQTIQSKDIWPVNNETNAKDPVVLKNIWDTKNGMEVLDTSLESISHSASDCIGEHMRGRKQDNQNLQHVVLPQIPHSIEDI